MRKSLRIWSILAGNVALVFFITKLQQRCIDKWRGQAEKNRGMYALMNHWVNIKQEGKNLEEYFLRNHYIRIAVYGMGDIGQRLVKELKNSEIEIVYGIDKNSGNIYSDIELVTVEEGFKDVDAIVVTVIKEFDVICDTLKEKINCPILAIADILNEF